jgi:hypothetical protein
MDLSITFSSPSPTPACGFIATYRRKSESSYTSVTSSGTTIAIELDAAGSYEGKIYSDCCSGGTSDGVPYGTNLYVPVGIEITHDGAHYQGELTAVHPIPYDVVISGSFDQTCSGVTTAKQFRAVLSADTTEDTVYLTIGDMVTQIQVGCAEPTIDNLDIDSFSVDYGNEGDIPWNDVDLTPYNGIPYWDVNSGVTWSGSVAELPSFTLDQFTPTVTENDAATQGILYMSWINSSQYGEGGSPYGSTFFKVFDGADLIGTSGTVDTSIMGLHSAFITLTKDTQDLDEDSTFTFKTYWANGTLVSTQDITLPPY